MKTIIACLSLVSTILSSNAHNNFFLPGDSFFSVTITEEVIADWKANEESFFEFEYSRFDGEFMACGNIGYNKLRITDIDEDLRTSLIKAYEEYSWYGPSPLYRLEDREKKIMAQTNGMVALIYNKNFTGPLGLKLNEDWQTQGGGRYAGFIDHKQAVVLDWKLGPSQPPLNIKNAPKPLAHLQGRSEVHRTIDTPLLIKGNTLKINLVGFANQPYHSVTQTCPNLLTLLKEKDAKFITVKEKGFTKVAYNENGRKTEESFVIVNGKVKIAKTEDKESR